MYVQINTCVLILVQLLICAITITHNGVVFVVGGVVVCIGTVNKLKQRRTGLSMLQNNHCTMYPN